MTTPNSKVECNHAQDYLKSKEPTADYKVTHDVPMADEKYRFKVFRQPDNMGSQPRTYATVLSSLGAWKCSCHAFTTVKTDCRHILACMFELNGGVKIQVAAMQNKNPGQLLDTAAATAGAMENMFGHTIYLNDEAAELIRELGERTDCLGFYSATAPECVEAACQCSRQCKVHQRDKIAPAISALIQLGIYLNEEMILEEGDAKRISKLLDDAEQAVKAKKPSLGPGHSGAIRSTVTPPVTQIR